MLEPPALVAGLHDVAVVGQPVEQCGGHLGVAKYLTPFPEAKDGLHESLLTVVAS